MIPNMRSHCFYSPFRSIEETILHVSEDENVNYPEVTNLQQVDRFEVVKHKIRQIPKKFKVPSIFCSTRPQSVTLDQVNTNHVFISTLSGIEPPFSYSNFEQKKIHGLGRDVFPISLPSNLDTDNR